MKTRYEKDIYQFLSLYRFFSFGIAVLLLQVVPLATSRAPDPEIYYILGSVGMYTFLKVFSPFRWTPKGAMIYVILGGDLLVCVTLVLYTGGVDSGFLLYSLTPIMTGALLLEEKTALSVAALSSLSLLVAHLGLSQLSGRFAWIMQGNYLPLVIIYIMSCFLIGFVAYRTNLNVRRRIERDAILEERRRIKQEMHDGVAQALGYLNLRTKGITESVSSGNIDKALTDLAHVQRVVQHTYEDIREGVDQLSTEVRHFPLIPTLAGYVREFGMSNDINTQFEASRNFPALSPVAEVHLLRIVQEALTNVRRHALASRAWVKLEHTPQEVKLMVKDNGRGFLASETQREPIGSQGLIVMNERAEGLGGTLSFDTAPGEGMEITVSISAEKVRL